ncbi:gfo/Idh/MocA family oxidoreductase [Acidipropionibacterium jensenii]|uniref:Gfo/Idh/MocA family oxidoreductase n=1 Tax=Acidipropionibacterium jensenii TaxID=1749 RepID=A0A3T0RWK6_9ACTN|nr:Gfo/Idh/MocA family oxidoreductase [Acidipropionibacterium jensenii]AZZ38608.1 gfo/Idh/MocA family oxidoreductase [Acidipropionibacterium jensenii]
MTMCDGRPVIGLVGAGGISRAHLPALLELGSRVLVRRRTGAEALVAAHSEAPVPLEIVDSLAELLDRSDVVDVVTPTPTHLDIVRAALEAGCDVVCEKPLARTAADARELADCAAATGSRLFPAHVVRYFPEYLALKRAVDRGEAGRLAVLRFLAHPNPGCSRGLNPPVSSRDLAMVCRPRGYVDRLGERLGGAGVNG